MSKSRAKGTAAETRFAAYFRAHGFPLCERRALSGSNDRGDLSGIPGVMIEVKNTKQFELAEWMDEVIVEKQNAKASIGVCIFPRRNHAAGRAYVLMELDQFIEMIAD